MKTKTIIPIAVVAIFITLAFAPAASAKNIVGVKFNERANEYEVDDENFTKLEKEIKDFATLMAKWEPGYVGMEDIKNFVSKLTTLLNCGDLFTIDELMSIIYPNNKVAQNLILSAGFGYSKLNFSYYEKGTGFIPKLTRVFIRHGSTAVFKYTNQGFAGYNKNGRQTINAYDVSGLYINGNISYQWKLKDLFWPSFWPSLIIGKGKIVLLR